ncbi:MAG: SpoIIE family protein phosphatase [Phycisphaerales bacterium]
MSVKPERLSLRPINPVAGDSTITQLAIDPPGPYVIGRSSEVDWAIPDQSVSRRHASVASRNGVWFVRDLGSRHGTTLNGARINGHEECPIQHGDLLGFGAWRCRCVDLSKLDTFTTPFSDNGGERASISPVDRSSLGGVAQRGLNALLELARSIDKSASEHDVAQAVVVAVKESTGCPRVIVTRLVSDSDFEILASTVSDSPVLSRSLIDAAALEGLVELRIAGRQDHQVNSIMELNIQSAICAVIRTGETPSAFLVLDSRDTEQELPRDAAAFCESVAQIAGLAFERLHSAELAARHAQLQSDMDAARRAQELLMPDQSGSIGNVQFVFESSAGRVVAGDFFDIFSLPNGSVAFFLGDVSGKGMGAAVLMAAAQSELRAHILAGSSLKESITLVNADLYRRTESSKFVTLIAGIINPQRHSIEIVDAGHGLLVIAPEHGEPKCPDTPNGFPLGVVEDADHETSEIPFPPGSLFVTFSDGVVEQPDSEGRQFGIDAAIDQIRGSTVPATAVKALVDAVQNHAAGPLADDLTVAAMQIE